MKEEQLPRNKANRKYANELRNHATHEENTLWYRYLRNYEVQFYRQYLIGSFIADFYCRRAKLVIEIDGSQHFEAKAEAYDQNRTAYFREFGIEVLRFTNRDINTHLRNVCDLIDSTVLQRIELLEHSPESPLVKGLPPKAGGDCLRTDNGQLKE